jgi:phage shock protein C
MYCNACGTELPATARYCHQCGIPTATADPYRPPEIKGRLTRPQSGKKIAGVCAGLARYLGMDVTLVRIVMVCLIFCPPCIGGIFYLVCWIVVPKEPYLLPPANFNGENVTANPAV